MRSVSRGGHCKSALQYDRGVEEQKESPKESPRSRAPTCPNCGTPMTFESGSQIHDLWAEHFVCETCGRDSYRSYGRGSV